MSELESAPLQLGDWLVSPDENRIMRDGESVRLEPKMMAVLLALASRPGSVFSKSKLLHEVWADTVVGEEVVFRSISALRKALGDVKKPYAYIETIPKSGYRLIAPVVHNSGDGLPPHSSVSVSPTAALPKPQKTNRWAILGAGVVLLGMIAALWPLVTSAVLSVSSHARPATSLQGQEFDPALSPDGNHLAFGWTGPSNGLINIYVKDIESETILPLTESPFYEYSPTWSPDGQYIAFARSSQGLFVIPSAGGTERKIADIGSTGRPHISWSAGMDRLLISHQPVRDSSYHLSILNLETLDIQTLTAPPPHQNDRQPIASPDRSKIAFVRGSVGASDLYVVPNKGGTPVRLTHDERDIRGVAWSGDGNSLIFASNRGGIYTLWQIPSTGGAITSLSVGGLDVTHPMLSAQGNRLAYLQQQHNSDLWYASDSDSQPSLETLNTSLREAQPSLSPDGSHLAYISTQTGNYELWTAALDGSNPVPWTAFEGTHLAMPQWSPITSTIALVATQQSNVDVVLLTEAGATLQPVTQHPALDLNPRWSADGHRLYFASNRTGHWELWVKDIRDLQQPARQVTDGGGIVGVESPDGMHVFYTKYTEAGIWQKNVHAPHQPATLLVPDLHPGDWANWALFPDGIAYVKRVNREARVWKHTLPEGESSELFALNVNPLWNQPAFSMAPDASFAIIAARTHVSHNLMVVDLE